MAEIKLNSQKISKIGIFVKKIRILGKIGIRTDTSVHLATLQKCQNVSNVSRHQDVVRSLLNLPCYSHFSCLEKFICSFWKIMIFAVVTLFFWRSNVKNCLFSSRKHVSHVARTVTSHRFRALVFLIRSGENLNYRSFEEERNLK